jgi:hypothetical protein
MNNLFESKLAKQEISKAKLFKRELRIGLLPEKMIIEFFAFYCKNMPFFDMARKVNSARMEDDLTSMLRQKQIIITFKEDYFFA